MFGLHRFSGEFYGLIFALGYMRAGMPLVLPTLIASVGA